MEVKIKKQYKIEGEPINGLFKIPKSEYIPERFWGRYTQDRDIE